MITTVLKFDIKPGVPVNADMVFTLPKYVYSYFAEYKNNCITLKANIHEDDVYNSVDCEDLYSDICKLSKRKNGDVVYMQPDSSIMLEVYSPYIKMLARDMADKWQHLEYDDLLQMCNLVLVQLARKGMYIHKKLLRKAFYNYVCVYLRHNHYDSNVCSFESLIGTSVDSDDKDITFADTVVDKSIEDEKQDCEQKELIQDLFNTVVKLLKECMTERECDQFVNDYMNGHTNSWSRRKMTAVKKFMDDHHITWESLLKVCKNEY